MTINYYYWECDHKYHCARQAEKKVLKSYSRKQGKAFIFGPAMASQNKANPSLVASSAKNSFSKSFLSSASKKQPNILQVDLSSKLVSNGKLISDERKKCLKNNLCLYYSAGDHKLDSCPKGHGASATANPLAAASKKLLEK